MQKFGTAECFSVKIARLFQLKSGLTCNRKSGPRPIVLALGAIERLGSVADQSSSVAEARRSEGGPSPAASRHLCPRGGQSEQDGERGDKDLLAATLNSGPASRERTISQAFAKGLAVSLTIATVIAPAARAIAAVSTISALRPA